MLSINAAFLCKDGDREYELPRVPEGAEGTKNRGDVTR